MVDWDNSKQLLRDRVANGLTNLTFLSLPNARRIVTSMDNPAAFAWPMEVPDPSNLTSLCLSRVRESLLRQLLAVTRGLRRLEWNWYYNYSTRPTGAGLARDPSLENPVIDLDLLVQAVLQVSGSLNNLVISGYLEIGSGFDHGAWLSVKGSLHGLGLLRRLRILEAPLPILLGSFGPTLPQENKCLNLIPTSLVYLDISSQLCSYLDAPLVSDSIGALVRIITEVWLQDRLWMQVTPHLRSIALRGEDHWDEHPRRFSSHWHVHGLNEVCFRCLGGVECDFFSPREPAEH